MNQLPPETAEPRRPGKPNVALWALVAVFVCFVAGIAAVGAFIYPKIVHFRTMRAGRICARRLSRIAMAMSAYAADYDDSLPAASAWMDQIRPYVRSDVRFDVRSERTIRCPEAWREGPDAYGYAMSIALSRKRLPKVASPSTTPFLFDSALLRRNAAGGIDTLPKLGRHGGGNNVAYADGHVRRVLAGAKP